INVSTRVAQSFDYRSILTAFRDCVLHGGDLSYQLPHSHTNNVIRISFTNAILRISFGATSRLILLHYQYIGTTNMALVTFASCLREAFLNFYNGAYEKESVSTIWVFITNELLLDGISWTNTICLVFEYVTIYTNAMIMCVLLLCSALSFIILYRYNLNEIAQMKKGAQVNSYSIARSFQIRENIAVFQMMLRVVFPTVVFNGPAYIFFFIYLLVPSNCGHEFIKHFSIGMFDLWIGISNRPDSQHEGDIYFKLFNLDMTRRETILMIIAQILALPFIVYRMYATRPLHVNIRLLLIHCFLSSGFSSICRLALLYFQYTGIPSPGSQFSSIVLLASIGRELGLGVVVSIPFIISMERVIATQHWSWWVLIVSRLFSEIHKTAIGRVITVNFDWLTKLVLRYEKEETDTLWIFVLLLFISSFAALLNGVCYIYGIYRETGNLIAFAIFISFGMTILAYIYHRNVGHMRKLALGARVNGYSVAHSYQIRENVAVMKFLFKLIIPSLSFAGPSFVAFTIFLVLPQSADYYRYLAVALFDVFVEAFYLMISVFLWYFVPKLRPNPSLPSLDSVQDGNQYFDWLTRDLNKVSDVHDSRRTISAI
ncbi:hypothetical protein PRIPAC_70452, partial [Pristionchus pacificus]|uniref:G protein-coupled receptor n=1 Tax=Pristionchus pacificus TaxID=54126 RepID=A0A2A6C172_PRIPA